MSGIWLDFHVFWATVVLRVEPFVGKCMDCIRGGVFMLLLNLPQSVMTANNTTWAIMRIVYYAYQPLKQGDTPEDRAKAVDMAVKASIWVAVVMALFREGSPLVSPDLNATVAYISSRFPWAYWAYWAMVALWCASSAFQWFCLRWWTTFRTIDRYLSPFKSGMMDLYISEGLYFVRKYRGHIMRIVIRCFESLVEMAVVTYSCAWCWKWLFGPLDDTWKYLIPLEGSWRDLIPLYRFVTIWILIQLGITTPRPTLRRWQIVDTIRGTEPQYEYTKLSAPGNIRLLLLHRRNPIDAINCTLFEVNSKAAPSYEAISYTWGNPLETDHLWVNGFRLRIPKSAYTVLDNRSSLWTPRLLWIDSICVNQDDEEEKVSQIQLMKNIYSNALFVSVCLQPPSITGNDVAETLQNNQFLEFLGISHDGRNVVAALSEPGMAADLIEELLWVFMKSSATELSVWLKYAGQNRQPRWLAFVNLLRNDWFNRIWVVQEVALASSVRVFYSKTEIPWQHLVDVMGSCSSHQSLASLTETTLNVAVRKLPPPGIINAQIMAEFRRKIMESKTRSMNFSDVLYDCDLFKATNPRDIIFGIQGLCNVENERQLTPDYNKKSEARVYVDAAVYLFTQETPLRLLSYAGIGNYPEPSRIGSLPSWAPDWSRRPQFARLGHRNPKVDYEAWKDDNTAPTFLDDRVSPCIMLQGRAIDAITSLGPIFFQLDPDATGSYHVEQLPNLYHSTLSSYQFLLDTTSWQSRQLNAYPYTSPPQPLREVFWRSLIGDRTATTRPAPASCADSFEHWLNGQAEIFAVDTWIQQTLTPELRDRFGNDPEFSHLVPGCAVGRRIFVTRLGYVGFVPVSARKGDEVCLLRGAQVPFVLRKWDGDGTRTGSRACVLVGEAYLHGIMDGVLFGRDEREVRIENFHVF
jgi:hypothetical protein